MADLRSRLQALVADIKHGPAAPAVEILEEWARRRKELDAELLRTPLTVRERQGLGREAEHVRALLAAAIDRTRIAAEVARKTAERERHAAEHPTILDPAPASTNALSRHSGSNAFTAAFDRSDDGYDR
ncbi:hypothetical protein IU436_30365 [Nocardia farcinica]|nr:hypothetical protein [Nocardia farcinica]MBF6422973.1 hypothetical protein [Nocardia farcinica]MBF6434619.1 hypothetical protein [Nocardia farcinica]